MWGVFLRCNMKRILNFKFRKSRYFLKLSALTDVDNQDDHDDAIDAHDDHESHNDHGDGYDDHAGDDDDDDLHNTGARHEELHGHVCTVDPSSCKDWETRKALLIMMMMMMMMIMLMMMMMIKR